MLNSGTKLFGFVLVNVRRAQISPQASVLKILIGNEELELAYFDFESTLVTKLAILFCPLQTNQAQLHIIITSKHAFMHVILCNVDIYIY